MATTYIEIETVIRGYHVYKEIWTATTGEALTCRQETDNFHDRFAVAIMKESDVQHFILDGLLHNFVYLFYRI